MQVPHRVPSYACEDDARDALAAAAAALDAVSPSAALSLRWRRSGAAGFLVTCPPGREAPAGQRTVVWTMLEERASDQPNPGTPAAEWRLHRDLYRQLHDVGAIVRSRPVFSTTLACTAAIRCQGIPAFHPDVALAGGDTIRCAAPAPFGSSDLSDHALAALEGRSACLLAACGLLVTGATLQGAAALSVQIEALAQIYCQILQLEGSMRGRVPG
jgi:L-fuculose-phosphate aldolase